VRWYIAPVTWQCAATGVPPTVKVPAGTAAAAVIEVLGKENDEATPARDFKVAPLAALSCGGSSSSPSEHPERKVSSAAGATKPYVHMSHWVVSLCTAAAVLVMLVI
jgi:hypothetical protein